MLHSSLQQGLVLHRRMQPKTHSFEYPVFMSMLDVDDLESVFSRSRFWSLERLNLVSFNRTDYIGSHPSLREEIKSRILESTGERFEGRILLLAHMRYLGFCFNPVSFYFCFGPDAHSPDFILAEINNTPWNERHCYVLDARNSECETLGFTFDKQFHVSPFMPMDLEYRWRFKLTEQATNIHMALYERSSLCFEAAMHLESRPFTAANMWRIPLKYPFITLSVVFRIYWQAFCLWSKRVPFHDHPKPSA